MCFIPVVTDVGGQPDVGLPLLSEKLTPFPSPVVADDVHTVDDTPKAPFKFSTSLSIKLLLDEVIMHNF